MTTGAMLTDLFNRNTISANITEVNSIPISIEDFKEDVVDIAREVWSTTIPLEPLNLEVYPNDLSYPNDTSYPSEA